MIIARQCSVIQHSSKMKINNVYQSEKTSNYDIKLKVKAKKNCISLENLMYLKSLYDLILE